MKKLVFIMPLMSISLLVSCNKGRDTTYTVTFLNEGKEYKKITDAKKGDEIIAPETNPEHSIDKKYNYTFNTWYYEGTENALKVGDKVEGNTTLVANYTKESIKYSVTFNYIDQTQSVKIIFLLIN